MPVTSIEWVTIGDRSYATNLYGQITSTGRFHGEPVWVPYFWDKTTDGMDYDPRPATGHGYYVTLEATELFPQLGLYSCVRVWQDDSGYIHGEAR